MGIQINGQTDTIKAIDGTMTLPGTVTYEDVSRVNVTGIVTAGQGLHVTSGSVGIGTDNPSKRLDIRTDAVEAGIVLNSSGRTLVMTTQEQPGVSQAAKIGTTSNHELRIITSDEERLRIKSTGEINIKGTQPTIELYEATDTYGWDIFRNSADARLKFRYDDGGTTSIPFTITPTSRIGIGTDNPSANLEVATSVDGEATLATLKNTSAGGTNETVDINLGLEGSTTSSNVILRAGKEANHSSGAATDNFFAIHTTLDNTSSQKLRITSDGAIHQTSTSFDSVYNGVITADSPTFVAENQTTDTYYRLTGGTYGNASSVSLDLSTHRAKNKGTTSSFRIKNYTGTTGSVADPKLAFITTRFETDDTTITEVATKLELNTSGIRVPHKLFTDTTSGNTGNTRTLTLNNIEEGAAYLVTLTRSPSLGTVSIYQTLIRYDGNGNFEGNDDIVNSTPGNMTITYGNASGGTATLTYVNGGTQRFRVTALRVN